MHYIGTVRFKEGKCIQTPICVKINSSMTSRVSMHAMFRVLFLCFIRGLIINSWPPCMNKGKEFREVGIKKGGERVLNIFQAKVFKKLQIHPHKLLLIAENSEKKVNSTQPE